MTNNHPIRRFLARICSDATMTRIIDPVLADIRWEHRPRWMGYLALARALALHSVLSVPDVLTRVLSDDGFAIPRMAFWTVAAAIVFTLPIVAPGFQTAEIWPALLLIPQGVVWTLPAVLLLAVPLALRGRPLNGRITRRTTGLGMVFVAVTFALILWIAPEANERYRQVVAALMKPDGEAMQFPNWSAAPPSRLSDYQYHQRLAFGSAALPLALLGLGLSTLSAARRRPWLTGILAAGAYMFVGFPLEMWTSALLLRTSTVPTFVLAWGPKLVVLVAALVLLTRRSSEYSALRTEH